MNILPTKKTAIFILTASVLVLVVWLIRAVLLPPTMPSKPPTIPSKPSDTALEFWIVENVDGINWAGHDTPYELYGGDAYLGKSYPLELSDEGMQIPKEYVIYTVTSWPDYSDDSQYVTEIKITDPAISVYGLTINSSFTEFDNTLHKQGYRIDIEKNEYQESHQATKNGITFSLMSDDYSSDSESDSIFTISAKVTNRENNDF